MSYYARNHLMDDWDAEGAAARAEREAVVEREAQVYLRDVPVTWPNRQEIVDAVYADIEATGEISEATDQLLTAVHDARQQEAA